MLKGYIVKMGYSDEFFFDNIEEAATFYDQALRHSVKALKWTSIEPVYEQSEQNEEEHDVAEEVKND
jgi:hypothetical protein